MIFSSITFLYYFIPWVVLLYFLVPRRLKNSILLLASLIFYAWGEPLYLIYMLVSIVQGYILGILIEKYCNRWQSKLFLIITILFSLGLLVYFKYADFFIINFNAVTGLSLPLLKLTLPIGISFYTFQLLSYAVDIYRGKVPAQKNIINFAAYVAMFPQLVAGPIVRYSDIAIQLNNRRHRLSDIAYGVRKFLIGLSKKILIANVLGELVAVFKSSDDKSVLFVWIYAFACTLQIYFDFSGYSDMAIGLGKIFGFGFPENFNYPYISGSISEFWRRWHMSLGKWFRDYLYIPLGGNRVSTWKWIRNILIVWMATGFWHGASWNFILWGLLFAILLIIEKLWILKYLADSKIVKHIYVLFFVIVSFIIFDSQTVRGAFETVGDMLGLNALPFATIQSIYYLKSYAVILIIAIIGATPYPAKLWNKLDNMHIAANIKNILEPIFLLLYLLVCTSFLVDGSFNPFLYFRF